MNACTHGEDRLLNESVKIPAEHFRAALDDLTRAAGGKLLVLVLFLDGLDLKIADALTRAHERDRADQACELVGGKEDLFHLVLREGRQSAGHSRGWRWRGSGARRDRFHA